VAEAGDTGPLVSDVSNVSELNSDTCKIVSIKTPFRVLI
jgi:hypothetical protein